ncbi:hypothetical protein HZS_1663 [Henneguya salminicola]|nr:hypothetical protein HZS_1663 [Henneguya salminicola]
MISHKAKNAFKYQIEERNRTNCLDEGENMVENLLNDHYGSLNVEETLSRSMEGFFLCFIGSDLYLNKLIIEKF